MSRSERDLVSAIRHELAAITPKRQCCRAAELDALADPGRRSDVAIARTVHRLSSVSTSHETEISPSDRALKRARALSAAEAPAHCRSAFLRGRILSRGSLSLASGRIHLELVLTQVEARYLMATFAADGATGVYRVRRGRGVIVWKDRSEILDLLRRLGAGSSISEIEARGVVRQIRGELNRSVNAETANLQRAVRAGMRQARAAAELIEEGGLPPGGLLQRVSVARLAHPEATIAELGETLSLSRSVVQRALATIERQAEALRGEAALP